jgi:conjugative relaxase-like TrwC/TraI family protein
LEAVEPPYVSELTGVAEKSVELYVPLCKFDPSAQYYSEEKNLSQWAGPLANQFGLSGAVKAEEFARLCRGEDPVTGERMVRWKKAAEYRLNGKDVKSAEHRVGWDLGFSAPKSFSAAAVLGRDHEIRVAHEEASRIALDAVCRHVGAHLSGDRFELTGKWVAAVFHHDVARPVEGFTSVQLHDHCILFNMTRTAGGKTSAIDSSEVFNAKRLGTSIYHAELARRVRALGYGIVRGKWGEPEIAGYTRAFIDEVSKRDEEMKKYAKEHSVSIRAAALATRGAKHDVDRDEQLRQHVAIARSHGIDPEAIRLEAAGVKRSLRPLGQGELWKVAQTSVSHAIDSGFEREAVRDHRKLISLALDRALGSVGVKEVETAVESRFRSGELIELEGRIARSRVTTRQMMGLEQDNRTFIRSGQNTLEAITAEAGSYSTGLTKAQAKAVQGLLESKDRVVGLVGVAGSGKSTALRAVRQAAEAEGYSVICMAPTSRAAQELGKSAGIRDAMTLQAFLMRVEAPGPPEKRLLIVDEASMVSTRMFAEIRRKFLEGDRAILVGDTRQHQSVDAGRFFESAIASGMRTVCLDEILRQQNAALRHAVELLAEGNTVWGVGELARQGRVTEVKTDKERGEAVARDYVNASAPSLVMVSDNETRQARNEAVRERLKAKGTVTGKEQAVAVLEQRNQLTGADRRVAGNYEGGDTVRYSRGSKVVGVRGGECVKVLGVDAARNLLTVERKSGERLTYDPSRLRGVSVFREAERKFAAGDRLMFTAPWKQQAIANRTVGTVESIEEGGMLSVRLDSGRNLRFNVGEHPHLDYGYATTTFSGQGLTEARSLVDVNTEQSKELVNRRMFYVAGSRGREHLQVYTNNAADLAKKVARSVTKESALEVQQQGLSQ